jgi:hypothetical protein
VNDLLLQADQRYLRIALLLGNQVVTPQDLLGPRRRLRSGSFDQLQRAGEHVERLFAANNVALARTSAAGDCRNNQGQHQPEAQARESPSVRRRE